MLSLSSECPLYDRLTGEFEASPTVQSLVATNKELFTYLTLHTGQNVSTIVDIEYLYDVLFIEVKTGEKNTLQTITHLNK